MEPDRDQHRTETQDTGEALSLCPSFNSYASGKFAEIAAKVTQEYKDRNGLDDGDEDDDDDDFEFALARSDGDVKADDIFGDGGQYGLIFPIFNRDLLDRDSKHGDVSALRLPLKKLFMEDREEERDLPSSSSSEADELEGVSPGTYCVWRPKLVEESPSRWKKSSSTGSASKRWKLLDLLRRSNSDGKDSFVFLTPKNKKGTKIEADENHKEKRNSSGDVVNVAGKFAGGEKVTSSPTSAHEVFYVRNRASKEGDKRKSYLPYRQDLVGFFANVNGAGRTFPPF